MPAVLLGIILMTILNVCTHYYYTLTQILQSFPFLSTSGKKIKGNSLTAWRLLANKAPKNPEMLPLLIVYIKYTERNRIIIQEATSSI